MATGSKETNGQSDNDPTTIQGGSDAAPSSMSGTTTLSILFTPEELQQLEIDVRHLTEFSVICRILGSRPSRGELTDLLYGSLQVEADKIQDIQLLGKGFYLIEFEHSSSVQRLLGMNPLDLRGAKAFFSPWHSGFNAEEIVKNGEKIFTSTAIFPNLPKEYMSFLNSIGAKLGIPIGTTESMASRVSRSNGMPSVKILVSGTNSLPNIIH